MNVPHASVLLNELLHFFEGLHLDTFLDATLGAGGHSEGILKAHPELNLCIGIDQDPVARKIAQQRLAPWEQSVRIFDGNFSALTDCLEQLNCSCVGGIIFDLGVSSMQFDRAEKGFSFMHEGPLDMRMDPNHALTAGEIVNTWSEEDLGRMIRAYGEEKRWRRAAYAIVKARSMQPLTTTLELGNVLKSALSGYNKKGIHPATLVFQALRICVNDELRVLREALPKAIAALKKHGRLAVISFHSLEDRIVKNSLRYAASDKEDTSGIGGMFLDKEPLVRILTRKPLTPQADEIAKNPRCRSAKLRVVEKL